ncbi:MAG TPA: hypothetical protein VFF16_18205, partial [Telluria sp.]|nr:hypothetical protein [Telluria sp.]
LEREADAMGAKAMQMKGGDGGPLKQIGASGNAPVQRYHMQDDAEGLFLAQEERDTPAGKTYMSTEPGKANLRGRKKSTIRVADTGELAIEAAPGREAKIFYGTPAIQQASNKVLKSLNSPIRLGVNGSLTLPVTSKTGQHKLLRAYYPIDVKAKKLGDEVQVPERCNEAGPHILNTTPNDNWLRVKLKTGGWAANLNGMRSEEAGTRIMRHFQKRKERRDLAAQYAQAPIGNFFRALANPLAGWLTNTRHDAENARLAALDHTIAHPESGTSRSVGDAFDNDGAAAIRPYAQEIGTPDGQNLAREAGINEYANPEVGEMLSIRSNSAAGDDRQVGADNYVMNHSTGAEIKNPFPYHYASVIAKSGGDYVTMENYARREGGGPSALDPRYFFKMYGTLAQSFHAESMADYPSAMTFVYGKQKQDGRPAPEFDTDSPQFEEMQRAYNHKLNRMSQA